MQRDIYEKALRLLAESRVHLEEETELAAYFAVEGDSGRHLVRLMRDNTFNCTCTWGSLKGAPHGALCSHVVAAVFELSRIKISAGGPDPALA